MQLREAIVKAAKFAWKGKQRSPTRCVRFLPSQNGNRSAVTATNGPQAILIFLEPGIEVPNAMVEAEKINAAVKGVKVATIEAIANATVRISGVTLEGSNVNEYPAIPMLPANDFHPLLDWWVIEKLLHAVSKDAQQPLLQCLHFRHDLVEATDRFRVARAFVHTPWEGLVPAATFRNWPGGDVAAAFSDDIAVFSVGDELRTTVLKRGTFQDCDKLLPPLLNCPAIRVETAVLRDTVKRVKALSSTCQLSLDGTVVNVAGGGFSETLAGFGKETGVVMLHVNAGWLVEALQHVATPLVQLSYTGPGDPLRVESGPFVVGLWPFTGG